MGDSTRRLSFWRSENFKGMAWMVLAMATFAIEDALVKRVAHELPVGQTLCMFGLGGALLFAALPKAAGPHLFRTEVRSRSMRVRGVFEVVGRLFYALAIALTPLSAATAILQATPVLVVLGGRLYFGERVSALRWLAVVAGLFGVLIVLRPAADNFSPLSILTVIGMIGFAGRDLASRAVPRVLGIRHLGFYGFLAVLLAGGVYSVWRQQAFEWPTTMTSLAMLGAIPVGVTAYTSLMKAVRIGDIGAVTPLRYTRLVFGIGLGVLAFGEQVDGPMLLGCAVIVAAGLLIALEERRKSL